VFANENKGRQAIKIATINRSGLLESTISIDYLGFCFLKFGAKVHLLLKFTRIKNTFFEEHSVFQAYCCLLFIICMVISVSIVKNSRKTIRKLVFSNPVCGKLVCKIGFKKT
jgi:hypothetical protein